jgi:hypothetical protein
VKPDSKFIMSVYISSENKLAQFSEDVSPYNIQEIALNSIRSGPLK